MNPLSTTTRRALLCFFTSCITVIALSQTVIIPYGSTWNYLDNNTRPANWNTVGFNDAGWSSGDAEFGYGDGPVTTINYGSDANNKYITTYFRKEVSIANPGSYSSFTLNVRRDDGVVVYINGTERYASNMPAGRNHSTLASGAASDDGGTPQTVTLSTAFFVNGSNTIAVELHQNSVTSTDLTLDIELIANSVPVGFISFGDSWKYLANNTRPANWQNVGFNDTGWPSGNSELGYGDGGEGTCVPSGGTGTACTPGGSKWMTTYFRKTFNITTLTDYNNFTMSVVRDDGFIVYINGIEVVRNNMPGGTPAHSTAASAAISGADESTPVSFSLSTCNLVEGTNTIAVEMHQNDPTSTDLSFNLQLVGNVGGGTPTLSRGPYLQSGSQTSMTVRWRTGVACKGRVTVGTTLGSYTTASEEETCATTEHIVTITGLTADTKYYYSISATDGTIFQGDANNFFRTTPPDTTTRKIRVIAFGDCGRGNSTYQDENLTHYRNYLTANSIDAPDAWILLGDNAYSSGTDAEYSSNFFGIYGNNILKNHKLYPAPGNHDYGNNSANKASRSMAYHSTFTVPQNGEAGGVASHKQNYYSYDVGNIHFLSLDSYGTESDLTHIGTSGTSPLKTWIDQDLAANTKKWTIAYWHHPPYTKTTHNSDTESDLIAIRQNFITYLESRGVDLIINGHSHGYERGYLLRNFTGSWTSFNAATHAVSSSTAFYDGTAQSCPYVYNSTPANHGTVYVVAGSTGASGGTQTNFDGYAFPFSVSDGGVLYFEVEDNRLDAKMLRRNGTVFDRFTIMKDAGISHNVDVLINNPVTLTASWPNDINNYNWNTSANTRSINFTPVVAGTTNFTVSDNFGCVTDQFSVTAAATLPVSLLTFDAVLTQAKKVNLNWSTVTESNNKYFEIERSANGRDFSLIATVNGAGSSDERRDYTYVDETPLGGTSYYRLSQTDIDNRKEYLGTRRIVNQAEDFEVKTLSSSNGKLVLQINTASQSTAHLRVYDMSGRERINEKLKLASGVTTKEFSLAAGVYIWEIRREKGAVTFQKVMVQ